MTLTLTGIDSRFDEAISLLHEFLTCPKADAKRMKHLIKAAKMAKTTFFKDNWQIALAAIQKSGERPRRTLYQPSHAEGDERDRR